MFDTDPPRHEVAQLPAGAGTIGVHKPGSSSTVIGAVRLVPAQALSAMQTKTMNNTGVRRTLFPEGPIRYPSNFE